MSTHVQSPLPFPPGGFVNHLLSIPQVAEVWKQHINHSFVLSLGAGTLSVANFKRYLIQDYLFLKHYARFICILASKAPSTADVFTQATYAADVHKEMRLHIKYCKEFGLSEDDMAAVEEDPACTAYVRFLKEVATTQDWIALQVALSPCMLGYKEVGQFLIQWNGTRREKNRYWDWVQEYSGKEYRDAVDAALELLEKYATLMTTERFESLVQTFIHAARLEIGFWDIGSHSSDQE